MESLRIGIVFPTVATKANGISDHSTTLATALADLGHLPVLIGATESQPDVDVAYVNGWPSGNLRDMTGIIEAATNLDVMLVQFEQFSYGRRGYNPDMSRIFSRISSHLPHVTKLIYFHETYAAPSSLKHTVMHTYQRDQARRLARTADGVIHSCQMGLSRLGRFNNNSTLVPVHPNIPVATSNADLTESRDESTELRVLVFGSLERRRATLIRDAFTQIRNNCDRAVLWYVGKDTDAARRISDHPDVLKTWHAPPPASVSQIMQQASLALSPFPDGVSGRRGSFSALMKHGIPTITNVGKYTDEYLRTAAAVGAFCLTTELDFPAEAAILSRSPQRRSHMHRTALKYFDFLPSVHASALALENMSRIRPRNERENCGRIENE